MIIPKHQYLVFFYLSNGISFQGKTIVVTWCYAIAYLALSCDPSVRPSIHHTRPPKPPPTKNILVDGIMDTTYGLITCNG